MIWKKIVKWPKLKFSKSCLGGDLDKGAFNNYVDTESCHFLIHPPAWTVFVP